jgi:ribosome-associated translation inhibitor RaiA
VHITVSGTTGAVDSRTRAYVEYRVFDALRLIERGIRSIDVSLTDQSAGAPEQVRCTIVLILNTGERIEATAGAEWPYAAIDRAVREASRRVPGRILVSPQQRRSSVAS